MQDAPGGQSPSPAKGNREPCLPGYIEHQVKGRKFKARRKLGRYQKFILKN